VYLVILATTTNAFASLSVLIADSRGSRASARGARAAWTSRANRINFDLAKVYGIATSVRGASVCRWQGARSRRSKGSRRSKSRARGELLDNL
jgi:hypothetical protein